MIEILDRLGREINRYFSNRDFKNDNETQANNQAQYCIDTKYYR